MVSQTSKLYALPLDRWPLMDPQGKGVIERGFAAACQMIHGMAFDNDLRIRGINAPLHEKWDYFDSADPNQVQARQRQNDLIAFGRNRGFDMLCSGPMLSKANGYAGKVSIPVNHDENPKMIHSPESVVADSKGYAAFPKTIEILRKMRNHDLARISVRASLPGTFYINWPDDSHIQKLAALDERRDIVYISLPAIDVGSVMFRGAPGATIGIEDIVFNSPNPSELNGTGEWVGNDKSGFFRCRTADMADDQGIWANCFAADKFPSRIQQVVMADEFNSPLGHSFNFKQQFPGGVPEAIGNYISRYANVCYEAHEKKPWVFLPHSPRYNRTSVPAPAHLTCDPLDYINPNTPMVAGIWNESSSVQVWRDSLERVEEFDSVAILFYAGKHEVAPVFQAIEDAGYQKDEFWYGVFAWGAEMKDMRKTLIDVQRHLESE